MLQSKRFIHFYREIQGKGFISIAIISSVAVGIGHGMNIFGRSIEPNKK